MDELNQNINGQEEPEKNTSKKQKKDKADSDLTQKKESIEAFLFRKEKQENKQVSPRLKNVFIKILARHKGNLEKAWSELWA